MNSPHSPSDDTSSTPPDHAGLLVGSLLLMALGWGGLYALITTNLPRIGGELWLFFLLLQVAVSGTALPIVRFINVRFTPLDREVPPVGVIVRQSVWVGLYAVILAWLQIPRLLNIPLAGFLLVLFAIIETFLRSREIPPPRR